MKSLKKTLSLVLVLVMVLGMFGIASATNFSDDSTIQYKEAVEVMTGIKAIAGFPDGSFGPTKTITRAEAAKMVAYAILGADVASALTGVTSTFSDVPANPYGWAIPSIEYLVKEGVVSGVGGGKFNPAGEITALEVAKMLLCAAGYGANDEYVGEGWALTVAIDANKLGIFAGRAANATDYDKPATREEVALYCFNALTTLGQVEYSPLLGTYVGKGTGLGGAATGATIGEEVYALKSATGIVTNNQSNTTNRFTTLANISGIKDANGDPVPDASFNIATGLNLLGHQVKVWYKSTYTGSAAPGVTYAVVDQSTVVTVSTAIANAAGWNAVFGTGKTNSLGVNSHTYSDYIYAKQAIPAAGFDVGTKAAVGTYVLNGNDIISYLASTGYKADKVVSYKAPTATAAGSIVLSTEGTIALPKVGDATTIKLYEAPAAGDIVILQDTGVFTTITKAGMGTGTVKTLNATTITTTDGTSYSKAGAFDDTLGGADWLASDVLGADCVFYTGLDGKVVAIEKVSSAVDAGLFYAVRAYTRELPANEYGEGGGDAFFVQGIDMTGKEVVHQVAAAGTTVNTLYKVSTASVGGVTIATLSTPVVADIANVGTGNAGIAANAVMITNNYYFASDVSFIYVSGTGTTLKTTVATGVQAVAAGTNYTYYGTKGASEANYTVKYVIVAGAQTTPSTSLMFIPADFAEATATAYTKADGSIGTAYIETVYIDGVATQIMVENKQAGSGADVEDDSFYSFTVNATTGIYTLKSVAIGTSGTGTSTVSNLYNGLLTTTGGNALTNANAASAIVVDVVYANATPAQKATMTEVTNLAGLFGATSNAVIYYTTATVSGATVVTAIYVTTQPVNP